MADQRFRGGVVDLARCRQDRVEFLEAMAAIVALVFVGWHLKTSFYNNFRQRGMPCRTDRSALKDLSLIHISEPTRQAEISYAVFCLKKKKKNNKKTTKIC